MNGDKPKTSTSQALKGRSVSLMGDGPLVPRAGRSGGESIKCRSFNLRCEMSG
jgi:hypothetical protein